MRARHIGATVAAVLALGSTSGCAGGGKGLDANGRPAAPGGSSSGMLTADFGSIQDHVFTPICTVCHAGASAPQGLRLDAANSYSLLVGVPSNEVPSLLHVNPGNPDASYIIQKLEGHAAVGAQMPFGGPPLPTATIGVIRQWITDGAQRGTATPASVKFTVESVDPAPNSVLGASPPRIVVGFSRELDATRVDASTLRLESMDDTAANAMGVEGVRSTRTRVVLNSWNPSVVMLTPEEPLPPGRYRIVTGAGSASITDLTGSALQPANSPEALTLTTFDIEVAP